LNTVWLGFIRNSWLSVATILVMTLTLFALGGLMLTSVIANTVVQNLEDKIDISVYFVPDAPEDQILAVKNDIAALPDVKEITYVSQDEALAAFKEKHKNDELIVSSLNELDQNPLEATLNIKAKDPSKLFLIADFLSSKKYGAVDKVNYFENQTVITRLSAIVSGMKRAGAVVFFVLGFVAVLVAFNTIRLAIYTFREEINIMRLVGASAWFIRGPFLMEGVLQGAIAAFVAMGILFPLVWFASPRVNMFIPTVDLFPYFLRNSVQFFAFLLLAGILLGAVSSLIAIRRYLKV
ncbi:ABC transporter permease, partial [Patescibacteria group bacterium]|nr:ABC transporter permease [Patescibacteria group bacterium]